MALIENQQMYCMKCEKNVLSKREGTNHTFHLIATVVTGGLWALVWLFRSFKYGGWRCPSCGTKDLINPST
jgi:DNA-directed RNA polymerase subunit RPC12/RpoP